MGSFFKNVYLVFSHSFFRVGAVVYLRFLSPEKFFGQEVSNEKILMFMESLKVPDYKFLPNSWMSYGLTSWVAGGYKIALTQSLYLYSTAFAGLALPAPGSSLQNKSLKPISRSSIQYYSAAGS